MVFDRRNSRWKPRCGRQYHLADFAEHQGDVGFDGSWEIEVVLGVELRLLYTS